VTVNAEGREVKREKGQAQYFTENLGKDVTLNMISVPGGKFMMGSAEGEGSHIEKPQHEVTIQPFFIGKYPVTQAQWERVAALPRVKIDLKSDPSCFKGLNRPIERVSWYDAQEFCARLKKHTGKLYRLPSEAEWEYACRAGTTAPFYFGDTITTDLANYNGKYTYNSSPKGVYRQKTTDVGIFLSNAFGLYDMHGNVWEWCEDGWHENYSRNSPIDGGIWESKDDNRMLRGGSWHDNHLKCFSAVRSYNNVAYSVNYVGFRIACSAAWA
jgi:formylglycine-generating enzyme required for sulfatase activity